MKEKMSKMPKGKSEAERYRESHMDGKADGKAKVGTDRLKKVSEKPSKMKGGKESMKGGMKGYTKSK